jgi:lipopolysaccharide transport system ATP-binding protein
VKRYSSGMYVRLAFAVAAHLNPEILIVDEVLAVGDADFQKKCLGKMKDVSRGEGRTVLFVSHNMAAVRQLCTQAMFLERGKIVRKGATEEVLDLYNSSRQRAAVTHESNEDGLSFVDLGMFDADSGMRTEQPVFNRDYVLRLHIHAAKPLEYALVNLRIYDDTGVKVSSISSVEEGINPFTMEGEVKIEYRLPRLSLYTGRYNIALEVSKPHDDRNYLTVEDALVFEVQQAIVNNAIWCYEKHHGVVRVAEGARVIEERSAAVAATGTV